MKTTSEARPRSADVTKCARGVSLQPIGLNLGLAKLVMVIHFFFRLIPVFSLIPEVGLDLFFVGLVADSETTGFSMALIA